ncbi:MAG: site-2 protease family protein [Planctomycetes bacterium]|nr:site-2 protease family protein [Planctomycetota bacterium]
MEPGSILMAALGIGLLITLHEAGHYMAARAAGVRVWEFSIGFGPALAGFTWRGTRFLLCAVPFGGYVRVAGMAPPQPRDLPEPCPPQQCLYTRSVGRRALFWSGGVLMNVLFALVVFPLVFRAGVMFLAPVAGAVPPGSAAWEVEIQPGERVVAVGDKAVYSFDNLMMEVALNGNRPVQLLVEAVDGARRTLTASPHFNRESGLYELGIVSALSDAAAALTVTPGGAAEAAGLRTGDLLLSVDGQPPWTLDLHEGGAPATLRVRRDGSEQDVVVTPQLTTEDVPPRIGVTPLARRVAGIRAGCALVERLDLRREDRLLAIDDQPFVAGTLKPVFTGAGPTRWTVFRDGAEVQLSADDSSAEERAQLVESVALAADLSLQLSPQPESPAADAGIHPGDWVVALNGRALGDWEDLREAVAAAGEAPLQVLLRRPPPDLVPEAPDQVVGEDVELTLTPRRTPVPDFGCRAEVAQLTTEIRAASFGEAMRLGWTCSVDLVKQLYVTLKRLLTGEVGANNLGGIIRIGQVSYHAAQRGPSWFWYFLGLLSVNLAFVNVLPIPVLDGGHLLFLLIEKVKGSPVSPRVFGYSQVIGLVFVLLLVLFVTYNDILRLL